MKDKEREGYSLVELLIAMAITSIVLSTLLILLSFGSHNMRITHSMVALQDQAKDAVNHISTYTMEASDIEWNDEKGFLVVTKESVPQEVDSEGNYPAPVVEKCFYWKGQENGVGGIYFAKWDKVKDASDVTKVNLVSKPEFLLVDHIQDFSCKVKADKATGKKILHVEMKLNDNNTEFECKKDVYMRNQKSAKETNNPSKGGGSDV